MEPDRIEVNAWVEERLKSLEPSAGWRPDAAAAMARLRRRESPPRARWWFWASVSASAAAAFALVLLVSTPSACANPLGCSQPVAPAAAHVAVAPAAKSDFKQSGSRTAPVTCELYTDYQCPVCGAFSLETLPQFTAAYVDTGKVRLIHRDFPLSRHRYARLAALYADAAGEAGYYQPAATKLFRTQDVWGNDGDIDKQVARAVPPAAMEKVRAMVRNGPAPEHSVAADEAAGRENRVDQTPTMICNRRVFAGRITFAEIQAGVDQLLLATDGHR